MGVPAAPAQIVDQLVAGDGVEPRAERLALVPGAALQMQSQQRLLHHVLCLLLAKAEQAPNRHLEPRGVSRVQHAKRTLVTAVESAYELGVGFRCHALKVGRSRERVAAYSYFSRIRFRPATMSVLTSCFIAAVAAAS